MRVVISDDSVLDSYGERVLVGGIKLERYLKNPVLLWMHGSYRIPVGVLKDLRVEGSKLTAEPVFHDLDEETRIVKELYEQGVLKGFSIGFRAITRSTDPSVMLPGQKQPTITECELFEVSCVTLPANPNAISMKNYRPSYLHHQINTMELIKKTLQVSDDATETQIAEQIKQLQLKASEADNLHKKLADLEKKMQEEKCRAMVAEAVQSQKITKSEEAHYLKLAQIDYESVKSLLEAKPAYQPISQQLAKKAGKTIAQKYAERNDWTMSDWQKKDSAGLAELKATMPEAYQELLQTLRG